MTLPADWLTLAAIEYLDNLPTVPFRRLDMDDRSPRVYEAAPRWPVRERLGDVGE